MNRSPVKLPRLFEIESPPESTHNRTLVEDSSVSAAMDRQQSHGKSRRSGRNRTAAPAFQGACHSYTISHLILQTLPYPHFLLLLFHHLQYQIVFFIVLIVYIIVVQ